MDLQQHSAAKQYELGAGGVSVVTVCSEYVSVRMEEGVTASTATTCVCTGKVRQERLRITAGGSTDRWMC
jgi:hypothetical protein